MKKQSLDISEVLVKTAGSVAGGVGAACLKKLPINSKISNGIAIAAGAVLPVMFPGNTLVESIGSGMIAVGGQKLLADVTGSSLIAGVDVPSVAVDNSISGAPAIADDNAISGIVPAVANNNSISGLESVNPNAVGMD